MYKIGELVKLSGGKMDDDLKAQFEDITRTILDNQASYSPGSIKKYIQIKRHF